MRLLSIRTINGPNIYSYKPVLVGRLDLGEYYDSPSDQLAGFNERLLAMLPGLQKHRCSKGYEGGFVERLQRGTYLAHIVEHVALELSGLAGIEVTFGKSTAHKPPHQYNVVVRYKNEAAMRYLLEQSVQLALAAIKGTSFDVAAICAEAAAIALDTELGPSTRSIVEAAERRNIPWKRLNDGSLIQFGYGKGRKLVQAAMTSSTSAIAMEIAGDKHGTKELLESAGVPVPAGEVVRTRERAIEFARSLRGAVAVKPLDGNQGKGITLNLTTPEQVGAAFDLALQYSRSVIVEEMLYGRDYRVLLVNHRVVAAAERAPAHVCGDGVHTIAQLVEIENQNPLRGHGHEKPLTKLKLDPAALLTLQQSGLTPDSVPAPDQQVFLRGTANLSTGGTAKDVTDTIHPANIATLEYASRIVGLDICGLDVIMPDISKPMREVGGGIVEANAAPGLRMHLHPSHGRARDVGAAIVDMLYPEPQAARIPIVSITGTNGKTTVTRLTSHVLNTAGFNVGMTTTDGIWIGGKQVGWGDTTGPKSAATVLGDPSVEIAVLETARGGLIRGGLAYDWSDVSILTNIQADHLGQDGIEDIDDILHIKSLVAERVREGGTLILNADDPVLADFPQHRRMRGVERNIVFLSLRDDNPAVDEHLARGGQAYYLSRGRILEAKGNQITVVCEAASVPMTVRGTAEFQVFNAMCALAASRALGLSIPVALRGLNSFRSSEHNPGRANLYHVGESYVLVDYGHNPAAVAAISGMTAQWHSVCVTGVLTMPGDRNDELILEGGRVAGRGFDKIIVREDYDRRGRKEGEVAQLLCGAIRDAHPDIKLSIVLDERESFERAISELGRGEVAVLFYDNLEIIADVLAKYNAEPVSEPEEILDQFVAGDRTRAA